MHSPQPFRTARRSRKTKHVKRQLEPIEQENSEIDYDDDHRLFDTHALNAETGDMTEAEVNGWCNELRKTIAAKFGYDSPFRVNTITKYTENGRVPKGVSYIYWRLSEVYHIILGRNPDGSERVKKVYVNSEGDEIDPSTYTIPDESEDDSEGSDRISNSGAWDEGSSFNDMMDANGTRRRAINEALAAGLVPTGYRIQHRNDKPLLPPFVYHRANKSKALLAGIDTSVNITIHPLFVTHRRPTEHELDYHKLSGEIPSGVTVDDLHSVFDIYSSHTGYPLISIRRVPNRTNPNDMRDIAFITYHPRHNEARFAREFSFFVRFTTGGTGGETVIRKFDHPWKR